MTDGAMTELAKTINQIGDTFVAFKNVNNERLKALEDAFTRDGGLADRIEALEAGRSMPSTTNTPAKTAAGREHMKRFAEWMRRPRDPMALNALAEFEQREFKALSIGTGADGGFAVPEEIAREIEKMEMKLSPVRNLVKVVITGTSDYKALVSERGATSAWVGEAGPRPETNTPKLRERAPTHGELYAYPQTSEWALDDVFFDIADWLASEVADVFAVAEADAVIRGNGTNKPTGFLNTAPVTTADFASPLRNAAALQYLPTPKAGSPAVALLQADHLIDLAFSLNARYRGEASWLMNSTTAAYISKLKDSQGQYLWQRGLTAGAPDVLLGRPVAIVEQMDSIGANLFPVAFGAWNRAYVIADRPQGIRITVDANITTPGRIKYFVRRREAGCVLNNDAAKLLKIATA